MSRYARAFFGIVLLANSAAAQFGQEGGKLVGAGAVFSAGQGGSVAISSDGSTAIIGGPNDDGLIGAIWVYTRSGGVWSQQGNKLVSTQHRDGWVGQGTSVAVSADGNTVIVGGPRENSGVGVAWVWARDPVTKTWSQQSGRLDGLGAVGAPHQGASVAISADGNTALVGGPGDASNGAVWVFTRNAGVWTQQGSKLVGTGAVGAAYQGASVAISADGSTAIVGGPSDNNGAGAAHVWTYDRVTKTWSQQGDKLIGGYGAFGKSVAIAADGNTAIIGEPSDNQAAGAVWTYTRNGGVWTQQGSKLVGTGAVGAAYQGASVAISADDTTAIVGGPSDNNGAGAAWVFASCAALPCLQNSSAPVPTLQVWSLCILALMLVFVGMRRARRR